MKSIGKLLAVAVVVAALGWISLSLYWHVKIMGAMSALKTQYPPNVIDRTSDPLKGEAFDMLAAAGCRSLPYLVDALDSGNNPELMWNAFFRILSGSVPEADLKAQAQFFEDNRVFLSDSTEKRREKIGRIQTWWAASGAPYHQGWRVWSSKCSASN